MLSGKVLTRQNVGRLANYYEDGADDYYAKEGESAQWQGAGAAALGLEGAIETAEARERFRQLLAGEVDPDAPGRRFGRKDSKERIGIDLTFSAPKSISIAALVGGDAALIAAHDRAVAATVAKIEEMALARQKVKGKTNVETTSNLIVAKFRHETSREKDPDLHTHAVVMNLTQRKDGQWRALRNDEIVKRIKYFGAIYQSELAFEVQKAGRELAHGPNGTFELAGYSRAQIEAFSARAQQIEARLAEKGLTRETATGDEKQAATMATRVRKTPEDREKMYDGWRTKARALDISFDRHADAAKQPSAVELKSLEELQAMPVALAAKRSVRYAINHLSERNATMTERQLSEVAVANATGHARPSDIAKAIADQRDSGYLVPGERRYAPAGEIDGHKTREAWIDELAAKGQHRRIAATRIDAAIGAGRLVPSEQELTTQTAIARERAILAVSRDGRGVVEPVMTREALTVALSGSKLRPDQKAAVELILTTSDRLVGVQGLAGTGKSYMLNEAVPIAQAAGRKVIALAPYGSQVKVLREEGLAASTVASFLKAKDRGIDDKTIVVIDEAGVIPAREMEKLTKIIEAAGASAKLLGDTAQTKAIGAGRPFDQLQAHGMTTAVMDDIQRQTDPQAREAVRLAAIGRSAESLALIRDIAVVPAQAERTARIVADYVKLSPEDREQTLIVSGTNEGRRAINAGIREQLAPAGRSTTYDTLSRRDTTQAERQSARSYNIGDVVQPETNNKNVGLVRGELYRVVSNGPGNVLNLAHSTNGEAISINPQRVRNLSVYEPVRTALAPGDKVRTTKNESRRDVANGERFTVTATTAEKVTLTGKGGRVVELPADKPLHVDLAYATTIYSAQGSTANRVMAEFVSNSRTTAQDTYYVAISRRRTDLTIYTDNVDRLPTAVSRPSEKAAALDIRPQRTRAPAAEVDRGAPKTPGQVNAARAERKAVLAALTHEPPRTDAQSFMYHLTLTKNVAAIEKNGLATGRAEAGSMSSTDGPTIYGTNPVYLATPNAEVIGRVANYWRSQGEDVSLLRVDVRGIKLAADVNALSDYGGATAIGKDGKGFVVYDQSKSDWEPSRRFLQAFYSELYNRETANVRTNGTMDGDPFIRPGDALAERAIKLTGSAASLQPISPDRIRVVPLETIPALQAERKAPFTRERSSAPAAGREIKQEDRAAYQR